MIEWLISLLTPGFKTTRGSELNSSLKKRRMKMPQEGMTSKSSHMGMSKGMGMNGQGGDESAGEG